MKEKTQGGPQSFGWGIDSALFVEKNRRRGKIGRKGQLSVQETAELEVPADILWRCSSGNERDLQLWEWLVLRKDLRFISIEL